MKTFTVKRGRYQTKQTKIEDADLSADRAAIDEVVQAVGVERARAYQEAVACGDLGAYSGEVGGTLTLDQIIADARRLALPILAEGPRWRPIDAPHGGTLKDHPLMHAATMVNYHALRLDAASIEGDELRQLMVNAVMLGYRWCELVTNRDNLEQLDDVHERKRLEAARRAEWLAAWLAGRGWTAADLKVRGRDIVARDRLRQAREAFVRRFGPQGGKTAFRAAREAAEKSAI